MDAGAPVYQYDKHKASTAEVQKARKDINAEPIIMRVPRGTKKSIVYNKPKQREQTLSTAVMSVRGQKQHQELKEVSIG